MHKVDSEFESQLSFNSCPALVYGLTILISGVAMLSALVLGEFKYDVIYLLSVSYALIVVGVGLCALRLNLIVDRKLRRVTRQRALIYGLSPKVYNLTPFDFLTISREQRGQFEIRLTDSNEKFCMATFPDETDAKEFAQEVASFLNVRVVDTEIAPH